jgi:hypothetical protein
MDSNPLTDEQAEKAARLIESELNGCLKRLAPKIYGTLRNEPGGALPQDQLIPLLQTTVGYVAGNLVAICFGSVLTSEIPDAEGGNAARLNAVANKRPQLERALMAVLMGTLRPASEILAFKLETFREMSTEAKVSEGEFQDLARETLAKAAGKGTS